MKRLCFLLFVVAGINLSWAQDLVLTPIGDNPCMPGVLGKSPGKGIMLEYGANSNRNSKLLFGGGDPDQPTRVKFNNRFKSKIKIPLINKPNNKLMIGWNYYREEYHFTNLGEVNSAILGSVDDKSLKSSRLSAYYIHSLGTKKYLAFKAVASFNGDYKGALNFSDRYMKYDLIALYGVKPNPKREWGVGLMLRRSFVGNFPVLPFAIYNQTFNEKWGFEGVLPVSLKVRYNINPKSLILFGPSFESRSYSIDVQDEKDLPLELHMRRSELQLGISYQRKLTDWIWVEANGGYTHNFTTRFELPGGNSDNYPVELTPTSGGYFRLGIFLSPPRHKFK